MKFPCSILILILILIFLTTSCTDKKAVFPKPPVNNVSTTKSVVCDTVNIISYSCTIKPILKSNCYSCHSMQASDTGNIALDLETFSSFKIYLKLFYRNDSIYGSKFYNTILQSPTTLPMPPAPNDKLQSFELRMIKKWIDTGAPEN
jgi:hypothetical protein